jgi:AcrR family transcriptional regulator
VTARIRRPQQDRSQATMVRILDAFEKLLRKGSFETITMNDIASEAATGAGSIYARFDGKRTILLAVHDRTRERARRYFEALFNPLKHGEESVHGAIERVARGMLAWHKRHRNIIKTSLILDDVDIYKGISNSFHPWSVRLSELLIARGVGLSKARALSASTAILQVMTAILQQRVIFGDISAIGYELSDQQLIDIVVGAASGLISP